MNLFLISGLLHASYGNLTFYMVLFSEVRPDIQDKRAYLRAIVNEIFEKDIRHRVKIRNRKAFEKTMNFVINNFGATMSIKKLS